MAKKAAIPTADDFASCLSSTIGGLVQRYTEVAPEVEIIVYRHSYQGLLQGDYSIVDETVRAEARLLHMFGGSLVGNFRVKLTGIKDFVKCGLVAEGADPFKVTTDRLVVDDVDALHTIGGDDTNTTVVDLVIFLATNGYPLAMVGLPKTIDSDAISVRRSLGAQTVAEQGAIFARNIVAEYNSGSRALIVHKVMGRYCSWLTAATAAECRKWLDAQEWLSRTGLSRKARDVHTVYVSEAAIDVTVEVKCSNKVMDEVGNVTTFLSEGTGLDSIITEMEVAGEEVPRNPFGHAKLDKVNLGKWSGDKFAGKLRTEEMMIQKSGYLSRPAAANGANLALIKRCTDLAIDCVLMDRSGVIDQDEEDNDELTAIAFKRIKGGEPFGIILPWFTGLVVVIGRPAPVTAMTH